MLTKRFMAQVKTIPATNTTKDGTFEALVSAFNNVDAQNERVIPGAFAETIGDWQRSGHPLPIIFAHQWDDPWANIGKADPSFFKETGRGLKIRGELDIEDNPYAAQIYRLMKDGRIRDFSFAYKVDDSELADDGALNLKALSLIEAGPCLVGANDQAELLAMKAMVAAKGGSGVASDSSDWEADSVMSRGVNSDNPAAFFRAVSGIEHTQGDPDEAAHWALPHHKTPGGPANASAVGNARSRFSQTKDLKNPGAARTHIFETHSLPSETASVTSNGAKIGRAISKETESRIRALRDAARDVVSQADALLGEGEAQAELPEGKAYDPEGLHAPEGTADDPEGVTMPLELPDDEEQLRVKLANLPNRRR